MYCTNCGNQVGDSARCCTRCGQPVKSNQPPQPAPAAPVGSDAFDAYLQTISLRLGDGQFVPALQAQQFYEEEFKIKWGAAKMKKYAFVSHMPRVTADSMVGYSKRCMQYALDHYKGLARGMQNGVASFAVMAGEQIEQGAVDFVLASPEKHWVAFEMPVLVDLTARRIFYFQGTPLWGALMWKDLRNFVAQNFVF